MSRLVKIASLILLLTGFLNPLWAQSKLSAEIMNLIEEKENSFMRMDSILSPIKRDTSLLNDFILQCRAEKYVEGICYGLIQKGIYYRNQAEYETAIRLHHEAIRYSNGIKNIDFRVIALNMMGVVYRRKEDVKNALDYHKRALEIAEASNKNTETNLRSTAVARNSIGNIYLTLQQYELAKEEFIGSIAIEEKLNNKLGLAINYQNIGGILESQRKLSEALIYYKKSLEYNEEINSDLGRVICLNSIGQIYLEQGKTNKAIDILKPTLTMSVALGDAYYITMAKKNYGWALINQGENDNARILLNEALAEAQKRNIQLFIAESYKQLASLSEKTGDFKNALRYTNLFHENEGEYLNERNQQYMAQLIMKYDTDKKKNQIEILEKENELVNLKLTNNRRIFSIAAVCLALLATIMYILYHQNRLKTEKEILDIEQRMMRSQMNPHFIFNSLNSIKLYIINNEKDKAVYYLNKFSKLIRIILATSRDKDISLKEELETMELYMNIENIRFSNKIDYQLNIELGIDSNQIRIPSMILQPFLENAIWHGLSSLAGDKKVQMNVRKKSDNAIVIEITDNGIGREKSKQIKAQKTLKNPSVGIDLTQERLNNYYKDMDGEHSLEITDLYENGLPIGTKVALTIPHKSAKFNFEKQAIPT